MVMRPPPTLRARPCLIEFSTSGCRIMLGTMTSSVSGLICLSTLQLRAEADDLDVEVLVDRLELLAQRDEVIGAAHQPAQQARELRDQHARRVGLRADERRDRRERVEQEVRVDLAGQRLDLRREQQLFLLLQPVLDARVVPDLDRRRDGEHRREQDHAAASTTGRVGGRVEEAMMLAPARARAPGGAARARSARAAARPASRSARRAASARRGGGRPVKTNGEKCQIASFGHSSRRPPPAKPQPTAKGSATHSPVKSGGRPTISADDGAGVRAGDQARRGTRLRASGRPRCSSSSRRATTPAASGMPRLSDEDQPIGPVAALEDEDVPEPPVPHQHRGQRGHRPRA